jgi:hypothetical protein
VVTGMEELLNDGILKLVLGQRMMKFWKIKK